MSNKGQLLQDPFLMRGFGVAVGAHAMYDVFVLLTE